MTERPEPQRVFLDADVLIAGSHSPTGASHLILQLSELGLIEAVSSEQVRRETERNLAKKLPGALPMFRLLAEAACGWVPDPTEAEQRPLREHADPKDLPILTAAVEAGCGRLVTFNVRDYRPPQSQITVASPGDFVRWLRAALGRAGGELE